MQNIEHLERYIFLLAITYCIMGVDKQTFVQQAIIPADTIYMCQSTMTILANDVEADETASWSVIFGNGIILSPDSHQTMVEESVEGDMKLNLYDIQSLRKVIVLRNKT